MHSVAATATRARMTVALLDSASTLPLTPLNAPAAIRIAWITFPMEEPARPNIFVNKAAVARQGLDIEYICKRTPTCISYPMVEIQEKKA